MFKLKKLPAAIKLGMAATMSVALSGCLVEGDSTVTTSAATPTNNFQHVTNPTGQIVGVVQDIQGNPIAGARVSVGGREVTTGVGGTYQFSEVPVTDVVVNTSDISSGNNATQSVLGNTSQALVLTIVPPSGYLGATVTVTAPSTVIDYGGDKECSDSGSGTTNTTCEVTAGTHTFIDGFVAQAGAAILPALNATVMGTLRDSSTGELLTNTDLSFRMTGTYNGTPASPSADDSVLDPSNAHNNSGVTVSYAIQNLTTSSDDNGEFILSGMPSKSELIPTISGYSVGSIDFNTGIAASTVSTNNWTSDINVGTIMFSPNIASADTINPFVTRVASVTNGSPGIFNDDIDLATSGLIIDFSEALASSIDISTIENSIEILVWDDNGASAGDAVFDVDEASTGAYATIASIEMSEDRKSIRVMLDSNITEGQSLHVNLLGIDFTDLSGNPLTTGTSVSYDTSISGSSSNNGNFVRLSISTFVEINKDATAVTLAQGDEDTSGTNIDADVVAANTVFKDVQDNDSADVIQQLNATDDDGVGVSQASSRLYALQQQIGGSDATAIDGDVASLSFTPSSAAGYIIAVADENGTNQTDYSDITAISGNVNQANGSNILNGADGSIITLANSSDVTLNINDVEAGWTVTVYPVDGLGYFGSPNTVTLVDNVPPTTVLQTSYGVTGTDYLVTGDNFGNGGELSNGNSDTGGTPILNVTAQLLDNLQADGEVSDETSEDDNNLIGELYRHNRIDTVNTNSPYITTAYDSEAFTEFTDSANTSRKLGVAFSEDIAVVSGTNPSHSGAATFSGWSAMNDVTQDDNGSLIDVDLMTATVDNIFTLANDGVSGSTLDFSGAVEDASEGNIALSAVNPKVMIRDALPPFISSGSYDGDSITLVFNEDVAPQDGDVFNLVGQNITLGTTGITPNYTYTSGTRTLVINDDAWNNSLDLSTVFNLPAYTTAPATEEHGLLGFYSIEDTNGNNWNNNSAGITFPIFALVSNVDTTLSVNSSATSGNANNSTTMVISYESEHRIDMTNFGATANALALTAAQVDAIVTVSGTGVLNVGGTTGATLSGPQGNILTVTLEFSTPVVTTDTVSIASFDSAWDNGQSFTAADIVVP